MISSTGGISSMINNWCSLNSLMASLAAQYKSLLQQLKNDKDPGHALWLFQLEAMPMVIQSSELNLKLEADALNVATAIREQISNTQAAYNNIINIISNGGQNPSGGNRDAGVIAAESLLKQLQALSAELKTPGLTAIFGASQLQNLNSWKSTLNGNIRGSGGTGGYVSVYFNFRSWYYQGGIGSGGGTNASQFQQINSSFNNLNEVVSGVSATMQSQMQYLNQNLQQYLSVYNNFFTDYQQWSAVIVSNLKTG